MPGAEDKPEKQRQSDSQDAGDSDLEDVLRRIGSAILEEDVPERLRRVLRPNAGSDGDPAADGSRDQPSGRLGTQRRDRKPSG